MENSMAEVGGLDEQQNVQEPTTGRGGPRKPGNLWTVEARDDVFKRREAGEGWETICLDYPRRSRHAMQQQYSMMKKQMAVANGTWVSGRRGRKRKASNVDKWAPVNKAILQWDEYEEEDETEDDDFEEADLEDSEEVEETPKKTRSSRNSDGPAVRDNFRPPLPVRSATDPLSQPAKSKIITFPHIPHSATLPPVSSTMKEDPPGSSRTSTDNERQTRESQPSMYPYKRRKRCAESPLKSTLTVPMQPAAPTEFPSLIFEDEILGLQARISEALSLAKERAQSTTRAYETEKSLQRRTFEEAIYRANRRADEAQEILRQAHQDAADTMKLQEIKYTKEIEALKDNFEKTSNEKNKDLDRNNTAQVEVLRQHLKEWSDSETVYRQEIVALREQLKAAQNQIASVESTTDLHATIADLRSRLSRREQESISYSELRERVRVLQGLQMATKTPVFQTQFNYRRLSLELSSLKNNLEDCSMRAITKGVNELVRRSNEAKEWMEQAEKVLETASTAFNAFAESLNKESGPLVANKVVNTGGPKEIEFAHASVEQDKIVPPDGQQTSLE